MAEPRRAEINQDVLLRESGVIYGHDPRYRWDAAPLRDGPFIREALRVSRVRFAGNPKSRYNEYIRYTKVLLYQLTAA